MGEPVDKQIPHAKGAARGGAYHDFAGGFREREREHVGYVVFMFCRNGNAARLGGAYQRHRELVFFAEYILFYFLKRYIPLDF